MSCWLVSISIFDSSLSSSLSTSCGFHKWLQDCKVVMFHRQFSTLLNYILENIILACCQLVVFTMRKTMSLSSSTPGNTFTFLDWFVHEIRSDDGMFKRLRDFQCKTYFPFFFCFFFFLVAIVQLNTFFLRVNKWIGRKKNQHIFTFHKHFGVDFLP